MYFKWKEFRDEHVLTLRIPNVFPILFFKKLVQSQPPNSYMHQSNFTNDSYF